MKKENFTHFKFNEEAGELYFNSTVTKLGHKGREYKLVKLLCSSPNRIHSYEEIAQIIGFDSLGRVTAGIKIGNLIYSIRKKLGIKKNEEDDIFICKDGGYMVKK